MGYESVWVGIGWKILLIFFNQHLYWGSMLESTPEDWIQVLEMCVTLSYMQFLRTLGPQYLQGIGTVVGAF